MIGEGKLDPENSEVPLASYGRARYCGYILHT